jgi:hypothetical protein
MRLPGCSRLLICGAFRVGQNGTSTNLLRPSCAGPRRPTDPVRKGRDPPPEYRLPPGIKVVTAEVWREEMLSCNALDRNAAIHGRASRNFGTVWRLET